MARDAVGVTATQRWRLDEVNCAIPVDQVFAALRRLEALGALDLAPMLGLVKEPEA